MRAGKLTYNEDFWQDEVADYPVNTTACKRLFSLGCVFTRMALCFRGAGRSWRRGSARSRSISSRACAQQPQYPWRLSAALRDSLQSSSSQGLARSTQTLGMLSSDVDGLLLRAGFSSRRTTGTCRRRRSRRGSCDRRRSSGKRCRLRWARRGRRLRRRARRSEWLVSQSRIHNLVVHFHLDPQLAIDRRRQQQTRARARARAPA